MSTSNIAAIDVHAHYGDRQLLEAPFLSELASGGPDVVPEHARQNNIEWTVVSPLQAIAPRGRGASDVKVGNFDLLKREFERSPRKKTTVQNLRQALEDRLQRMLAQNPLRTEFQQHYEEIVAEYNREKDRVTIEKTFEDLLRLNDKLDEEERRTVCEGLHMESLAIFDLLKKPELEAAEIKKIKSIAVDLLATLKAEKLRIDQWRDKEATRGAVKLSIRDFLYGDEKGLPVTCYTEEEVIERADNVCGHVYRAYPTLPSPYYQYAAVA